MGAGASASAAEAVTSISPEEMQAAFEALTPEQRQRLQDAMAAKAAPAESAAKPEEAAEAASPAEAAAPDEAAAATEGAAPEAAAKTEDAAPAEAAASTEAAAPAEGAAAEAAAPAEAKAEEAAAPEASAAEAAAPAETSAEAAAATESVAPAEAAAEGAAQEAKAAAPAAVPEDGPLAETSPFLAAYFQKAQERTEALIADHDRLKSLAFDPEAQKKLKEESKQWYHDEAKPLLEKSFKQHDTRENDTLDPQEAARFFQHLISQETKLAKAMSALSIDLGIKMSVAKLENMLSAEEREEVRPQIEAQIKAAIEAAKAEVQKKEDNYLADKAAHDAAAFKVLDVNGDGTLELAEFIAAFEPETERNTELHLALGYLTQEEIDTQKKMEADAREKAGDSTCNQQ